MYAPLNIKTNNSLLKSTIKIDELIQAALKYNIKALTLTDQNMYGALEFYTKCIQNNIKPIIGLEINIKEKLILYAENYSGYRNLLKLTTLKDELTINDLNNYSDNLICLLPYESKKIYNQIKEIYKYIFITYKNEEEKSKIRASNILYMDEILCINKEDEIYLKYLKAIDEGKKITEIANIQNKSLLPLKNFDKNNEYFVEMCNLKIETNKDMLPVYDQSIDAFQNLKDKCIKGMKRIFGDKAPKKYAIRLKKELEIINKMGFCNYFLIVADYVKYAKENDILVGPGRGSAAGCLVAYCLNITTIDPLKYNLLFERFLNPERITMPDIDIDFEDTKREKVIKYCIEKYGSKKVALIVTFAAFASRQAIRDISKVVGANQKKTDELCKLINSKLNLKQNYQDIKIKVFLKNNQEFKSIYKIASKIEGLKRHTSIHAAGIIMSKERLDDYIPLDKINDIYVSEYDKDYLEQLGFLKMDFLGLKNLTLISNILKETNLKFDEIKENDKLALNIFKEGRTIGIFQFESDGMKNFLKKLKPSTFEDVVSALALFRPGPMKNIDSYIKRKEGKEKIDYFHDDLKPILESTYGVIVYQEQIMQIAHKMAGYTLAQADLLRRAMSKKSESILLKEKDKFINGSIKNGYSEDLAIRVYDMIFKFADYGFNRSHSVAYGMISYKMAYLKAYYPEVFMKHMLSSVISSEEKTKEYIYECSLNGVIINKPNINLSDNDYKIINKKIIYPLSHIKGVNKISINKVIEERKHGNYKDIFDFVSRCTMDKTSFENLIYAGVFDEFENKQTLINNIDIILNYSEIGKYVDDSLKPEIIKYKEFPKKILMQKELDVLGFYLTVNPIGEFKKIYNVVDLKNINNYFDKNITVIVSIDKVREIETKNKEKMAFLNVSDELSQIEVVIFPKVYKQNLSPGEFLKIKCKVEKRFNEYQLIANEITKLEN